MARPTIHDERVRDQLLVAAGRVLATDGAAAVTVRRLAREVGTSTTAIYSLFGSKEGVVAAMFRQGFANLDDHLRAALDATSGAGPAERLVALGLAYRDAARARPHLYQVMFACPFPGFEPDASDWELSHQTLEHLRAAVADAVAADVLSGDVEAITFGLWGLVHGLASLEATPNDLAPGMVDNVWETTLRATVDGFRS